jgi:hypothetical protein
MQFLARRFGRFDLDIDRVRPILYRQIENRQLLLDAAIEFAAILMAPASREYDYFRKFLQETPYRRRPFGWLIEKIQTKLKESLAALSLAARMLQERGNVRQTKSDTDSGE